MIHAEPADALRMLRVGAVDVALVFRYQADAADPLPDPDLHYHRVLDEPVYLVIPAAGWPGRPGRPGLPGLGLPDRPRHPGRPRGA